MLEQLLPTGISIRISTKSDLILRDLDDLYKEIYTKKSRAYLEMLDHEIRKNTLPKKE